MGVCLGKFSILEFLHAIFGGKWRMFAIHSEDRAYTELIEGLRKGRKGSQPPISFLLSIMDKISKFHL